MPNEINYYFRKAFTIAYASILNFLIASFLSQKVETYLIYHYDETAANWKNLYNLCMNISIITIFAYILRQISEQIPIPFKSNTFDPYKVKEVKTSVLSAFTLFLFFGDDIKGFKDFLYEIF